MSKRVKTIIAELLIVVGIASAVVSSIVTPVTTCNTTIQQPVPQCTANYGSLILYEAISGAVLLGGIYVMAMVRKAGRGAPL
ncbi:MAG TPA: hypothetical protein VFE98_11400 [Candidatus Bathyarchaeia archaeon]|nr:hypothetical protein [Candidatus Bathyarchaeia archaeon]